MKFHWRFPILLWSLAQVITALAISDALVGAVGLLPVMAKNSFVPASAKNGPVTGRKITVRKSAVRKTSASKEATSSPASKSPRKFERSEEDQCARAIKLKLHMFSESQIANNLDSEGWSVKQRVLAKIKDQAKKKQHIPQTFWSEIIANHRLRGTVTDGLTAPVDQEGVRRELDVALKSAHDSNPAHRASTKFCSLMKHMDACNRTEFYGLLCGSFESPSLSKTMASVLQPCLLRYISRVGMAELQPDYWKVVEPYFDNLLALSWQSSAARRVPRANWMRANRDTMSLFVDMVRACRIEQAVVDKEDPDIEDVEAVCKSSVIGQMLFASESVRMESRNFLKEVTRRIYEVEVGGFLEEEMTSFRQIIAHLAENLDADVWRELDAADLEVPFLTTEVSRSIGHACDHGSARMEARVRTLSVSGMKVPRYPWETFLFGPRAALPDVPEHVTIPEHLYFDCHNAREYVMGQLNSGWQSVASMKQVMRQCSEEGTKLDETFWMDEFFAPQVRCPHHAAPAIFVVELPPEQR